MCIAEFNCAMRLILSLQYGTEMYKGNLDFASLVNLVAIRSHWDQYLYRDAVLKLLDKVFKVQPVDRPSAEDILTKYFTTCSGTCITIHTH